MNPLENKSNRIEKRLHQLRRDGRKAFIPFIVAGDPTLAATEIFVRCLEEAGADMIEIGVPFSDPAADGPVIIAAAQRALICKINLHSIFELVSSLRMKTEIPLLLLLYTNTIWQYGIARFFTDCRSFGIDGIIIPDLPYEEQGKFRSEADAKGIFIIQLVTPVSGERLPMLTKNARGFLYCVSDSGVTGERRSYATNLGAYRRRLASLSDLPCVLGFGISSSDQAKMLSEDWDGLIIGSALVRRIGEAWGNNMPVSQIAQLIRDFACSVRRSIDTSSPTESEADHG